METLQLEIGTENKNVGIYKDPHFEHNKRILHERYQEMVEGNAEFISIEDYEKMIDNDLA